VPIVRELALAASEADIHFTIDAEEAERLELSLDIIEDLVADDALFANGWQGFGLALQAYQKRAVPLCEWVAALARRHNRRLMVRLVKGAYWDSEIKLSQVGGHRDYPVFTRKVATDVSYLACAAKLLAAEDAIYPAFATHNAYTIGAIKALAAGREFEFQRLHGMGEDVYEVLAEQEGDRPTRVRIYAPVGGHKDLLAYLVRRLLENGANSSFVNRMADADVPVAELVTNPVSDLAGLEPKRNLSISLPADVYPNRRNSSGIDLADPPVREPLLAELEALAGPRVGSGSNGALGLFDKLGTPGPVASGRIDGRRNARRRPGRHRPDARPRRSRPARLGRARRHRACRSPLKASDLFEAHAAEIISLCQREAGKTLTDSVLELREAVDFLRYYAGEARMLFSAPQPLPGPTGEQNLLRLHGRGVFATISPWNFPLAIFIGMASAAIAAGNTVIAKPAEQTPLIAAFAVRLCHEAGIPTDVLQLAPATARSARR
jgi:RHH-type proline utilization regulon transcriptional repressor/proline dehydrogenase/delta 1-pyrroline-5-carboxylate dehydrogenase